MAFVRLNKTWPRCGARFCHDIEDWRGPVCRDPTINRNLGIETASQSSLAKVDELGLDRGQHEGRLEHRLRKADRPMSDLTAVDILIQPDAAAIDGPGRSTGGCR